MGSSELILFFACFETMNDMAEDTLLKGFMPEKNSVVCVQFNWKERLQRELSQGSGLCRCSDIVSLLSYYSWTVSAVCKLFFFFQNQPNFLLSLILYYAVLGGRFPLDPNFPFFTWHAQICRLGFLHWNRYTACDCLTYLVLILDHYLGAKPL